MEDKYIGAKEAAEYLGIKYVTLRAWIRQKKIPGYQIGRLWRFKISELDEWVKSGASAFNSEKKTLEKIKKILGEDQDSTKVYKNKEDFRKEHCYMCGSQLCAGPDDEFSDGCPYFRNAIFEENEK